MTRYACPTRLLAPRSLVPNELRNARIGNLDESGALAIAYLVRRKLSDLRRYTRTVLCDINNDVYVTRAEGASIDLLQILHPEIVCGTYTADADAAQIAGDLETMRRMV